MKNRMVDDESAFDEIDFDVIFGAVEKEDRRVYDAWVHAWLVMLGFGGRPQSGAAPIQMAQGVTAEVFRRHERFDFTVEKTKADPDGWQMHIFDRETGVEAAVL